MTSEVERIAGKGAKKSQRRFTIAVRPAEGETARKITKIIGLNGDGFSVLTPYHKAKSGFVYKNLMDLETLGQRWVPFSECVGFTAEDRVKLTYHVDGFAQFSGENPGNIISGRDPNTGEPKGVGLFTRRLKNPIVSGPSVGITVHGIEDFEPVNEARDNPVIVFEPNEVYYRRSSPQTANCWHLAIYAMGIGSAPPLRYRGNQAVMDYVLHPISGATPGSVVELKMIYLEEENLYLGLHIERFVGDWPSKSGWSMSGPGTYNASQIGYVLNALYPRELIPVQGRPALDRNAGVVVPAGTGRPMAKIHNRKPKAIREVSQTEG